MREGEEKCTNEILPRVLKSRWQFCHAEMWKGEEKRTYEGALCAFSAQKPLPRKVSMPPFTSCISR